MIHAERDDIWMLKGSNTLQQRLQPINTPQSLVTSFIGSSEHRQLNLKLHSRQLLILAPTTYRYVIANVGLLQIEVLMMHEATASITVRGDGRRIRIQSNQVITWLNS